MNKKIIQIIVTSILLVIFIFAWGNAIKAIKARNKTSPTKVTVNPAVATSQPPESTLAEPQKNTKIAKIREKFADLNWGRCPFYGESYSSEATVGNLKLSGILWDEKSPKAIINSQILDKGSSVGNYTIVDIQKERVILSDGTKNIELKL